MILKGEHVAYVDDKFKEIKCPHCKKKIMILMQFDRNGYLKWIDVDTDNEYKSYPKNKKPMFDKR